MCDPGMCVAVAVALWAELGGGEAEGRQRLWHLRLLDRIARCDGRHALIARFIGLPLVRPPVRPQRVPLGTGERGTARKYSNSPGRGRTCGDAGGR
jgi:hypothetical protein